MLENIKRSCANQFEAAFATLAACVERCGDSAWDVPVANHPFCRVAFHVLFYADYYLEPREETFRQQPFHRANPQLFRDYEELEDRPPRHVYDRPAIRAYLKRCREKAADAIAAETAETLAAPCGFARRHMTRAELHVYNIRHVQHHAAQMSLRLRLDADVDIPWIGTGWRDV